MRVDKIESESSIYKPTEYKISFKTTDRGEFDTVMGNRDNDFLVAPKVIFEKEAEKIISKRVIDMCESKPLDLTTTNKFYDKDSWASKLSKCDVPSLYPNLMLCAIGSGKIVKLQKELYKYIFCHPNNEPDYKVIFNPPATILWKDGKKYVSKAHNEEFDEEKGLLMCLAKANGISHLELKRMIKNAERPKETKKKRGR